MGVAWASVLYLWGRGGGCGLCISKCIFGGGAVGVAYASVNGVVSLGAWHWVGVVWASVNGVVSLGAGHWVGVAYASVNVYLGVGQWVWPMHQ